MTINLAGYIYSDNGTAINNVGVTLIASDSSTEDTATTNSSGYWHFEEADEDVYDVKLAPGSQVRYFKGADKISLSEIDVRNSTGATTPAFTFSNTYNSASNYVGRFRSLNSSRADGDEIYLGFNLLNDAGEDTEFARITVEANDVSDGNEDGEIRFDILKSGTRTTVWKLDSSTTGATAMDINADTLTIGAAGDTDVTLTFDANTGDGTITWMEDEDYFKFSDDILMNSTEKIQFYDTGIYIYSSTDGQLDLVADTEIQIAATTIDINGAVAFNGALTGITNITLSGTLSDGNYTFDTSGNVTGLGTVASGAITSSGNVTSGGSFIIGSADIDETDLEKLDGITDGTAAASKAVVLDGSKNIATIGTIGSGAITATGTSSFATAVQTPLIEYTDGDDAITIADGGLITAANGITSTAATNTFGVTNYGSAGSGVDVQFFSATSGDHMLWDASDEKLVIIGTDGNNALEVTDGNVAITDNLTVSGDLTVSGTTTTIDTTNLTVTDPLIKLAQGTTASPANDLGIIFTRGNGSSSNIANRAILWDESADVFVFAYTNDEAGTTTGNVDLDDYANVRLGALTADDASTFTSTISAATGSTIGNLTLANGSITDSSGAITFNDETLTTSGAVDFGAATVDSLTSTGDITTTGQATDWDLIDNNASALSFDASGKTGILDIVTTDGSEGVTMSGTLGVTGTATLATVDIGAGAIDGTAIGASSASTIVGTTIDAGTDFTIGDTVITDGVITDSSGLALTSNVTLTDGSYNLDIASHDGTNGLALAGTIVTATAAEINLIDGSAKSTSSITIGDTDAFLVIDGTTTKQIPASDVKTYTAASATALDDIATGDAAASLVTTVGNITIDAQANDADVIIKVDDAGSAVTAVTFDGSAAGDALFVNNINVPGEVMTTKISYTDGDDAITIADGGGTTFAAAVDLGSNTLTSTGSMQIRTIDYSDGDLAVTIADGGGVTFAQDVTMTDGKGIIIESEPADDAYTGIYGNFANATGSTITKGQVVYMTGTANQVAPADATDEDKMPAFAMAIADVANSASGNFLLYGFVHDSDAFVTLTIGGEVYVSDNTAGALDATAPDSSGEFVQIVGMGMHANKMLFNPQYPMVEVA